MDLPPSKATSIKQNLKLGIRQPTHLFGVLSSKEVQEFFYKYGEYAAKSATLPPIMTNFASDILKLTESSFARLTKLWK